MIAGAGTDPFWRARAGPRRRCGCPRPVLPSGNLEEEEPVMLRRYLATVSVAAGLTLCSGCLSPCEPLFPRLRSMLPGSGHGCPAGAVCDSEGPILDAGEP